jgi:YbbR domain-containing protein
VKRRNSAWQRFLLDNVQWMLTSVVLAFGLWIIAALQTDPVRQEEFPVQATIEILRDDNMIVTSDVAGTTTFVTLRGPDSVLDSIVTLRPDQIRLVADMRGLEADSYPIELEADLANGLRGQVVSIRPAELNLRLEELDSARISVQVEIAEEPPSGYSYPPPTCNLSEVTASGPATVLSSARARVRLDLSEERNPVTLVEDLEAVDARNDILRNVVLEPATVECQVEIAQREGVSELSVVPEVTGVPPEGYIYQGFTFEPNTVVVTGQGSTIRQLNGVVRTEAINIRDATGNIERTVSVILPEGVRLLPTTQTINVTISIGTIPGSRQIGDVPIQLQGLRAGLEAVILPDVVTVLAVGPQPILQELAADDFRVVIDLSELGAGSYQRIPSATIIAEYQEAGISLTLQPSEVSVTLTPLDDESLDAASTPVNPTPTANPSVR